MSHKKSLFLLICLVYQCETQLSINNPSVTLHYCTVTGTPYRLSLSNGDVQSYDILSFFGIPYAMPPTDYYRLRPPRSINTRIDCSNRRVKCLQFGQRFNTRSPPPIGIEESEDCLHLNIFSPVKQTGSSGPFPVLVYIHGGEFKYGGKDMFKPDYLYHALMKIDQQIVIVTVNYRLGVLGFLSTDDENQPGNNGIRDQILALQWVKENILKFNGNPSEVTIMGHDAGAVSVGMHVLNKDVFNYFRAAISISGTVFSPWAFQQVPVQQARDFGNKFNCPYQTSDLVECLRNSNVYQMIQFVQSSLNLNTNRQPFWFRPVVDKNVTSSAILVQSPKDLYKNGLLNRVPYLLILTENEGTLEYYLRYDRVNQFVDLDSKIAYLIRPYINPYADEDVIASALHYQYFDRTQRWFDAFDEELNETVEFANQVNRSLLRNLSKRDVAHYSNTVLPQIISDLMYIAPMDYTAHLHSAAQADVIMFIFDYTGTKSFGTLQIGAPSISRDSYGSTHNNDQWYCWLNDYDLKPLTNDYREVALYLSYSNFLVRFVLLGTGDVNTLRYSQTIPSYNRIKYPDTSVKSVPASNGKGYRTGYSDFINNFVNKLEESTQCFRSGGYSVVVYAQSLTFIILIAFSSFFN